MKLTTYIKSFFYRRNKYKVWSKSNLNAWVSFYNYQYKLYGYYHGTKNLPKNRDKFRVNSEGDITEYIIYNIVFLGGILVANLICVKGTPVATRGNYLKTYWNYP